VDQDRFENECKNNQEKKMADERRKMAAGQMFGEDTTNEINL
jgi:hypothetical protein